MINKIKHSVRWLVAVSAVLLFQCQYATAYLMYCSSENTADTSSYYSIYMSNGYCENMCSGYALAIVQGPDCWCSNTLPADTNADGCDTGCPGYSYEKCGGDSVFGYIELATPSSTSSSAGLSSSSSSSTSTSSTSSSASSSSSSTEESTSQESTTQPLPSQSTVINTLSSLVIQTSTQVVTTETFQSTSSSGASVILTTSTRVISHSPSVKTITTVASSKEQIRTSIITSIQYSTVSRDGSNVTESSVASSSSLVTKTVPATVTSVSIVTPSSTAQSSSLSSSSSSQNAAVAAASSSALPSSNLDPISRNQDAHKSFFDSRGKVAGLFTGIGILVILIIALLTFLCLRRQTQRQQQQQAYQQQLFHYQDDQKMQFDSPLYYSATALVPPPPPPPAPSVGAKIKRGLFSLVPVWGKRKLADNDANSYYNHYHYNSTVVGTPLNKNRFSSASATDGYATPMMFYSGKDSAAMGDMSKREKNSMLRAAVAMGENPSFNFVDDRLQPPMMFIDPNESNPSLEDNKDYTRRLKIINP